MNTIPLVKGNTQEEINTSLIALKKALDEMNSSSGKTDASVQSQIKQINELITNINSHLDTIDGQITDLQPVDTVTSGNMHSVTSNAVANALLNKANGHASVDVIYLTPRQLSTPSEMTSIFASKSDGIYLIKVGWEEYESFWGAGANGYAIVTTGNSACVFGKLRDYSSPNYMKWFGWIDRVTIGSYQGLNSY